MWVQIRNSMAVEGIWYPLGDANMKCIQPDCQNITISSVGGMLGRKSYLNTIGSGAGGTEARRAAKYVFNWVP